MQNIIPEKLNTLAKALNKPLYIVGGTCRDYLAGLNSPQKDFDICSPTPHEELIATAEAVGFSVQSVYKNTGTVKLFADGEGFEYSCFRSDKYVRGVHSPVEIYFTDDIYKDARRRDFKCNAVYYDICGGQFVDPLGGIADILAKRLTTVDSASKVFGEDGLRLMRLCRQAAQTGFYPSEECLNGAIENAYLIDDITPERVWAELSQILQADEKYGICGGQYVGLKLLHKIQVLQRLMPELTLGDNMAQRPDFHDYDVLEHSLRCVMYADKSIRLSALLHDVGKPRCKIDTGKYALHEEVGEGIARDICARLKVSKAQTALTCQLVKYHMYDFNCQAKESKVRKFIVRHYDILPQLQLIKQADFSACKDDISVAPGVDRWYNVIAKMQKEGAPFTLKQLKVRGDKLIGAGVQPKYVSAVLQFLLEECAVNPKLNNENRLISYGLSYQKSLINQQR